MKKSFLLFLFFVLLYQFSLYSQEQFVIDINSYADGIISRDQLDLFTYYDKNPSKRAVDYLVDLTQESGFIIGINNNLPSYGITPQNITGIAEKNSVYLSKDSSFAREAGSFLLLGWNKLGGEDLSLSFFSNYSITPLSSMLFDGDYKNTQCGKSSLSLNIYDTIQVGIDLLDRYSNFSLSAHGSILKVPDSLSDIEITLFNGAVTLFDAGLASLFTEVNLTDQNIGYTMLNLLTPVSFLPYVFYDNFIGDNTSYLALTLSTMPVLGLDFLITPRFSLHNRKLQSLETTFEMLSLFSFFSPSSWEEKTRPGYRLRDSEGDFIKLLSMGPYYRDQFYDRYTGLPSEEKYIGFVLSAYMKEIVMKNMNPITISTNFAFEYNLSTGIIDLTYGLKYYF